jgi:hypothetical protein
VLNDSFDLGVLAADDVTPVTLGLGLPVGPSKAAVANGMLFLPSGYIYGGSRLLADKTQTGLTFTVNHGDPVVHGSTSPTPNWNDGSIDPGMLFRWYGGTGADTRYYVVKSVDAHNQITLATPWLGDSRVAAGAGVEFTRVGFHSSTAAGLNAPMYIAAGNKLLALMPGGQVRMAALGDPFTMVATEMWQLPAGVELLGGEGIRDRALIFTTAGVWAVSNLAYSLLSARGDPQQRLEQVSRDLILWSWAGVAQCGTRLVVPAVDGVWLADAVSAPQRIPAGIDELYRSYRRRGLSHRDRHRVQQPLLPAHPQRERQRDRPARLSAHRDQAGPGVRMDALLRRRRERRWDHRPHRQRHRAPAIPDRCPSRHGPGPEAPVLHPLSHRRRRLRFPNGARDAPVVHRQPREELRLEAPRALRLLGHDSGRLAGGRRRLDQSTPDAAAAVLTDTPASWAVAKLRRSMRFRLRTSAQFVLHSLEVFVRPSGRQ